MAYLVFWLAYPFDLEDTFIALIGVLVFLFGKFVYYVGMAWHSMFRVVPFAFSVEKSTPPGKKYASSAGGAGDKSQLCNPISLPIPYLSVNNIKLRSIIKIQHY